MQTTTGVAWEQGNVVLQAEGTAKNPDSTSQRLTPEQFQSKDELIAPTCTTSPDPGLY